MAKLSTYEIESAPLKVVPLRLGKETVEVGLRFLSGGEVLSVLAAAKAANGDTCDEEDPEYVLHLWIETVAAAAVDPESGDSWASSEELRDHPLIGQENLLYMYEIQTSHQEDHSVRPTTMSQQELLTACIRLAGGDESPLDGMRAGTLRGFARSTASLLFALANDRLPSFLEGGSEPTTSTEKPQSKPAKAKTKRKKASKR